MMGCSLCFTLLTLKNILICGALEGVFISTLGEVCCYQLYNASAMDNGLGWWEARGTLNNIIFSSFFFFPFLFPTTYRKCYFVAFSFLVSVSFFLSKLFLIIKSSFENPFEFMWSHAPCVSQKQRELVKYTNIFIFWYLNSNSLKLNRKHGGGASKPWSYNEDMKKVQSLQVWEA